MAENVGVEMRFRGRNLTGVAIQELTDSLSRSGVCRVEIAARRSAPNPVEVHYVWLDLLPPERALAQLSNAISFAREADRVVEDYWLRAPHRQVYQDASPQSEAWLARLGISRKFRGLKRVPAVLKLTNGDVWDLTVGDMM